MVYCGITGEMVKEMQRRIDKKGTLLPTKFAIISTLDGQFSVGNETDTVNTTVVFSQIILDSPSMVFHTTGFSMFIPDSNTITLEDISNTIGGATNRETILDFYATTPLGQVMFNIDGFESTTRYQVRRGGLSKNNTTSDSSGDITFQNTVWSEQHFKGCRYENHREYYCEVG